MMEGEGVICAHQYRQGTAIARCGEERDLHNVPDCKRVEYSARRQGSGG